MLNIEKYGKELLDIARRGVFAVANGKPVLCSDIHCTNCYFGEVSYDGCDYKRMKWLANEYVEPKVDWSKVKVDTPILVSDDGENWYKSYFAFYHVLVGGSMVFAWRDGATSWSNRSGYTGWKYAKLAEDGE